MAFFISFIEMNLKIIYLTLYINLWMLNFIIKIIFILSVL